MVSHYLFEAEFCSPASGWEKGQIEKNVQDARHRIWQTATTRCAGCAMQPDPRVTTLKQLKLFGMAQAIEELASQGAPAFHEVQPILDKLLKAELAEREVRSIPIR